MADQSALFLKYLRKDFANYFEDSKRRLSTLSAAEKMEVKNRKALLRMLEEIGKVYNYYNNKKSSEVFEDYFYEIRDNFAAYERQVNRETKQFSFRDLLEGKITFKS